MKEDYENNKETGQFKLDMTPVYFPHNTKSPDEYGIIVVDFQNKKIYSSQDYSGVGNLQFYNFWSPFEDLEEKQKRLKTFLETGLIKEMSLYDRKTDNTTMINLKNFSVKDIEKMFNELENRKINKFSHSELKNVDKENVDNYFSHFIINSDWKFVVYHDRSIGILKIKKELNKDGFSFTKEDNESWKEYLSHHWMGYDFEELENDSPEDYLEFKALYQEVFNEPFFLRENE